MKLAAIIVTSIVVFLALLAYTNRKNRLSIATDIVIEAPASVVWAVLTDTQNYSWNPFISRLDGDLTVGNRLHLEVGLEKKMAFKPIVLVVEPARELRWLGRLVMSGVFDGEHVFELQALPDGTTKLNHYEEFEGFLVPLLMTKLMRDTVPGFEAMNEALKAKAEEVHSDNG